MWARGGDEETRRSSDSNELVRETPFSEAWSPVSYDRRGIEQE